MKINRNGFEISETEFVFIIIAVVMIFICR